MSNPGERDDAPEVELEDVDGTEDQGGGDGSGSDGDEPDAGDTDEAGGEADAGAADDAGADEGQAGQPAQVRGQSRAQQRIAGLSKRTREAEERAQRLEQELNTIRQQGQGRSQAEMQAERRARLELMSPEEKTDFLLNEQEQRFNGAFNQLRFEQADSQDRNRFDSVCARKPHFDAIKDEVEAELQKMRRNGATAPRETIALYLIGKKADERASKGGVTRQAARGKERVASQRVSAPSGRSDVRQPDQRRGGNDAAARRSRLENQQI